MNHHTVRSDVGEKHSAKHNKDVLHIGNGCRLTLQDVKRLAVSSPMVAISETSYESIHASHAYLKSCVDQRLPVYGVNTNFGDQVVYMGLHLDKTQELYYESIHTRQVDIVKSLACGLGEVTAPEIVKATMLLRAHCLAQGYSGISPTTLETVLKFLNADVIPVVQRYGSIGASGDLIPLASIAAGYLGENIDVFYRGVQMKAPDAIRAAGLPLATLELRDGLALINGTSFMTAIASTSLFNLKRLYKQMLSAIGMALESMLVIDSAYQPLVHQVKGQQGEMVVNQFFLDFWQQSQLLTDLDALRKLSLQNHATNHKPMQDCYSLRAVPQGFGPFQESLELATTWIENEMNSVNDNPIIDLSQQKVHHNANFMGYYIVTACDLLKANIAQASTWLHALLANMVHARKNHGLPTNLAYDPSTQNGFRSMQLLAAALAVQNRKLAQSQQAYMLPTEGDNQDVNSLGTHAAFDFQESVLNLERLTTIVLLASVQALEMRGLEKAGAKSQAICHAVRMVSPKIQECRPMSAEINQVINLLREEKMECM